MKATLLAVLIVSFVDRVHNYKVKKLRYSFIENKAEECNLYEYFYKLEKIKSDTNACYFLVVLAIVFAIFFKVENINI